MPNRLVHTITVTAANVHDIAQIYALVREDAHIVYGDSGDLGVEKRAKIREVPTLSDVEYCITKRSSQNRMAKEYKGTNWDRQVKHTKASVRSKAERPFLLGCSMWERQGIADLGRTCSDTISSLLRRISLCV
mgnify:CR=1 FL=1